MARGNCCLKIAGPLLFLWGLSAVHAGQEIEVAGVRTIRNSDVPANGTEMLDLEELWRAGGAEDDEIIFGLVTRVLGDPQGNVYVFDAQLHQALVFSPAGELLATHFRQGEGPGEVRTPRDMVLTPGGGLGLLQGIGGRLVQRNAAGDPADAIMPQSGAGRIMGTSAAWRGGTLLLSGDESIPGDRDLTSTRRSFLASFSSDGREQARFLEESRFIDYQNNFTFTEETALRDFRWCFDVGPNGRVYFSPERNRYAITVCNPDGSVDRVIERRFESRQRSQIERQRMQALIERRFRTFPFDLTVEIADTEADIGWLYRGLSVLDDGTLWVRHSRSSAERRRGVLLTFDVFDPDGHFERQVAMVCEGNPVTDGFFPIGGDRFVQVRGFLDAMRSVYGGGQGGFEGEGEPDPIEVVCHRARR